MNTTINRTAIVAFALTMAIAGSLYAAANPKGGHLPERTASRPAKQHKSPDNPSARARWMDQWYNENYANENAAGVGGKSGSGSRRGGVWSYSYQRFMMAAAKQERLRYASKMPVSGTSKAMIDPSAPIFARSPANSLTRDLRWTNLGPTKANSSIAGGSQLSVTDTGRVVAVETHPANPNIIYAAFSGGGLWKTMDGGASWQAKTETLGSLSVGTVALDPNNPDTLYLGLGHAFNGTGLGIVKMTHGGDVWQEPVLLGDSTSVRSILVAPSNSNIVLAATDRGLFRSTDAGKTYVRVTPNASAISIPETWSLAHAGGNTIVLSLEAAPEGTIDAPGFRNGEIWRSTDNGATWVRADSAKIPQGVNRITLASAPSNPSILYALASKPRPTTDRGRDLGTIFRSTNGGATWTPMATDIAGNYKAYINPNADYDSIEQLFNGQGWFDQAVVIDRNNPDIAYFGGAQHVAKTTNGGQTYSILTYWTAEYGLPYVHSDVHSAHISANGTLYLGTDGGIFASSNGGASFTDVLNEGIASHLIYNLCSTPANPDRILIGLQDNGSRLRVGNTGVFNEVVGGDGFGCSVNSVNPDVMLASLYYSQIQKSTDGGATFAPSCSGINECDSGDAPFRTVIEPWDGDASGNTLYTITDKKAYRSQNFASSWVALGVGGLPGDHFLRNIGIARTSGATPNDDSVMGVVANSGRVYLSTNTGGTWTPAGALPNNGFSLSSIAFDPVDRNVIYVSSIAPFFQYNHLWRSTDFGATWATIDGNGFPAGIPVHKIVVDPTVRTTLYAATHLGAYRSLDSGTNWERLGSFLPLVEVTDISVLADGNRVRAATFGRGVWELAAIGANVAPVANFNVAKTGLTATFTDTSTDSDGSIVRRQWNFGDGVNSSSTSPQHTYAAPGTYTVQLVVTDNAGYTHSKSVSVTVAEATNKARNDINGDGRTDFVLKNSNLFAYWLMNGSTVTNGVVVGGSVSGYEIRYTGDFNGDGRWEAVYQNATGNMWVWFLAANGTTVTASEIGTPPSGWSVFATADVNGDGRTDLLLRNGTLLAYWLMNGATVTNGVVVGGSIAGYQPTWAGDFNGDGRTEVIYQNAAGNMWRWQIGADGSSVTVSEVGSPASGWSVFAVDDINGDGRTDYVLRNGTLLAYWLMDGSTVTNGVVVGGAGGTYVPARTGDFDGDGRAEVIYEDPGRNMWRWALPAGGGVQASEVGTPATGWSVLTW